LTSYFDPGTVLTVTFHMALISYRFPGGRRGMVGILIVVAVLVGFDLAAVLWGADSRITAGQSPSHHVH
jgi:hypothetical protein